jgi:hypothetical protein
MKATIKVKKEVEITMVKVDIPVRYDEEDIPNDFPLREGDIWSAIINIDEGRVLDWPKGQTGHLAMKVCDGGSYFLLDKEGNTVLSIEQNYVPNELLPGEYGDYIDLHIGENGLISNWYSQPSISDFVNDED